jgi:hypothetical protein
MTRLQQIEQEALTLSESDRARLAAQLLQTLPAVLVDDDDGIAEAVRRDQELDQDPAAARSWDQIKRNLGR